LLTDVRVGKWGNAENVAPTFQKKEIEIETISSSFEPDLQRATTSGRQTGGRRELHQ